MQVNETIEYLLNRELLNRGGSYKKNKETMIDIIKRIPSTIKNKELFDAESAARRMKPSKAASFKGGAQNKLHTETTTHQTVEFPQMLIQENSNQSNENDFKG
jgi:hypothetical protein